MHSTHPHEVHPLCLMTILALSVAQEGINDSFFQLADIVLQCSGCVRWSIDGGQDKLYGRGDGSFLHPKFTGVAIFVRQTMLKDVRLMAAASCSLGFTEVCNR